MNNYDQYWLSRQKRNTPVAPKPGATLKQPKIHLKSKLQAGADNE